MGNHSLTSEPPSEPPLLGPELEGLCKQFLIEHRHLRCFSDVVPAAVGQRAAPHGAMEGGQPQEGAVPLGSRGIVMHEAIQASMRGVSPKQSERQRILHGSGKQQWKARSYPESIGTFLCPAMDIEVSILSYTLWLNG